MAINLLPASLQNIIQQGYLEQAWQDTPTANLGFRAAAERVDFPNKIGETVTKTRPGLRNAAITPLNPVGSSNLSSGMTASTIGDEQYTLSVAMYGDTAESNLVTEGVAILSKFKKDFETLREQAARSVDMLARNALFNAYMGGNTRLTAAASATSLTVDDVRGFSAGMAISVGGQAATIAANGVTPAGSNASTVFGGVSGTITTTAAVTAASGAAVLAQTAPLVIRPNARATAAALQAGDVLSTTMLTQGVAQHRANAVKPIDGFYNLYVDPQHGINLLGDQRFISAFTGQKDATEIRNGQVSEIYGVRLIYSNMNPVDGAGASAVRRAMLVGEGALVEGVYTANGYANAQQVEGISHVTLGNDIAHVIRPALDALSMWVTQSWLYIGGFTVPTDAGSTSAVIPTASGSSYKRGIILESL